MEDAPCKSLSAVFWSHIHYVAMVTLSTVSDLELTYLSLSVSFGGKYPDICCTFTNNSNNMSICLATCCMLPGFVACLTMCLPHH